MGWFLWGVLFGWGSCAVYYFYQNDANDRPTIGATLISVMLFILAIMVSINLGISSGAIPVGGVPTPTSLGR